MNDKEMNKIFLKSLKEAINLFDTKTDFTFAVGVSRMTVHRWMHGYPISPQKAMDIEEATLGKIKASSLNKILFKQKNK